MSSSFHSPLLLIQYPVDYKDNRSKIIFSCRKSKKEMKEAHRQLANALEALDPNDPITLRNLIKQFY